MINRKYIDFFNISKYYRAVVNADEIKRGAVKWNDYIPHKSFVTFLERCHEALEGGASAKSILVQGAYGTGKSYTIYTVKGLLEANDDEFADYFARNRGELPQDLQAKYAALRKKNILTVVGSTPGTIENDTELIFRVQEDIKEALRERGWDLNKCSSTLKDSILKWLESDPANRNYFSELIRRPENIGEFGASVDENLRILRENGDMAVRKAQAVRDLFTKHNIPTFIMSIEDLCKWIKEVIHSFKLYAVLFLWDEFTEYLQKHSNSLVGFQRLVEFSTDAPFYFVIVTHVNFMGGKEKKLKLLDRFSKPIEISLPEKVALSLMARAMEVSSDPTIGSEWEGYKSELSDSCSRIVQTITKAEKELEPEDLFKIIPIHPYSALLLKHLAVLYQSNQRSMFEFITAEKDLKAFRYFIENYGPGDKINMLTADLLWDYFTGEKQRGCLDLAVRSILESYNRYEERLDSEEEKCVLKTVLLLEAIVKKMNYSDILRPTVNNAKLALCYDYSRFDDNNIAGYINGLCEKKILTRQKLKNGEISLSIAARSDDYEIIQENKERIKRDFKLSSILNLSNFSEKLIPETLKKRFEAVSVCSENFSIQFGKIKDKDCGFNFIVMAVFARNEEGRNAVSEKISEALEEMKRTGKEQIIILDASDNFISEGDFDDYCNAKASSNFYSKSDREKAAGWNSDAERIIANWKDSLESKGQFKFYYISRRDRSQEFEINEKSGCGCDFLEHELHNALRRRYPYYLEQFAGRVNGSLLTLSNALKQGLECGISKTLAGPYKAMPRLALNKVFACIWDVDNYWSDEKLQHDANAAPIVALKRRAAELIKAGLESEQGRISLTEIVNELHKPPYGFYVCNLGAFVLGFILRDYAKDEFLWSNGKVSKPLNTEQLAVALNETLKNFGSDKQENYIASMTPQQREFLKLSRTVFALTNEQSGNLEEVAKSLRALMTRLEFPLFTLKELPELQEHPRRKSLENALDSFCEFVKNAGKNRNLTKYSDELGSMSLQQPSLAADLQSLCRKEKCRSGMEAYVGNQYPELAALSERIGCPEGGYLDDIRKRFSADALWLWDENTIKDRIEAVVCDYKIIDYSNELLPVHSRNLDECRRNWRERATAFKISASFCKDRLENSIDTFIELLGVLYATRQFDSVKFLETLGVQKARPDLFHRYLDEGGRYIFDNYVLPHLTGAAVSKADADILFGKVNEGVIKFSGEDYVNLLRRIWQDLRKSQLRTQIRAQWQSLTQSGSPREWSAQHLLPITCLIGGDSQEKYRKALDILNHLDSASQEELLTAQELVRDEEFISVLNNENSFSEAFCRDILDEYAPIFKAEDTQRLLAERLGRDSAYNWCDSKSREVKRVLSEEAASYYQNYGREELEGIIEKMDAAELKEWIKKTVIKDNNVGLQIILAKKKRG